MFGWRWLKRWRLYGGLLAACLLASTACSTSPPNKTHNICKIFDQRYSWYQAARSAHERWGVPIHITMAFVHQESSFRGEARPPRKRYLGFIPGPRPSSAYGYAQAIEGTWNDYREDTGRWYADRDDFDDAADFIGWYNHNTYRRNGIARDDPYRLYLAYHEGHTGYKRKSYQQKPWLLRVSRNVANRSSRYKQQLTQCQQDLENRGWFTRLFSQYWDVIQGYMG